jgi:hypothetical protein
VTARSENQDGLPANNVISTLDIPAKNANKIPALAADEFLEGLRSSRSPSGRTRVKAVAATSAGRNAIRVAVAASPSPAPRHIRTPPIR